MTVDNKRWVIAVVILLAVSLSSFYIGRASVEPAQKPSALVKPDGKSWTREEFSKAVMGTTKPFVIERVGKPIKTEVTSNYGGGEEAVWYYENIVDSVTGKSGTARVTIKNGAVIRVDF